ncbi:MAG: hypothetical protein JO269_10875 [Burkholderiaceae bacterium]|nr:hypothetical protein [Burkholderiaceae bacterium]
MMAMHRREGVSEAEKKYTFKPLAGEQTMLRTYPTREEFMRAQRKIELLHMGMVGSFVLLFSFAALVLAIGHR